MKLNEYGEPKPVPLMVAAPIVLNIQDKTSGEGKPVKFLSKSAKKAAKAKAKAKARN